MKAMRVRDLPELMGAPYPRPILWCSRCAMEYSADGSDYSRYSLDYVFKHCGRNMRLVVKQVEYVPWSRFAAPDPDITSYPPVHVEEMP